MNVEPSSSDCGARSRRLQETTAFCDIVDSSDSTFIESVAMISPTDTAYRLLPTSPSARELMDAYTPGLFELKFAEERTRQAAPRVGLLGDTSRNGNLFTLRPAAASPLLDIPQTCIHSSRSSIKGSAFSARCAGIHAASSPSASMVRTTPPGTTGSRAVAWYTMNDSSFVAASPRRTPTADPIVSSRKTRPSAALST